jgi:MSHA biogenesis protein MshP
MSGQTISRSRQRGTSLVTAVFLIVVLASLGAFAVRLTAVQQQTTGVAIRATQAILAAQSGIDWAAYRALNSGNCTAATLTLTEGGASGFSVSVTCTRSAHIEAGATINVYSIEALAQSGVYGGPDYVSRRLHAKVTDAS